MLLQHYLLNNLIEKIYYEGKLVMADILILFAEILAMICNRQWDLNQRHEVHHGSSDQRLHYIRHYVGADFYG
jgi:hypothetical protein